MKWRYIMEISENDIRQKIIEVLPQIDGEELAKLSNFIFPDKIRFMGNEMFEVIYSPQAIVYQYGRPPRKV